MVFNSLHFIIFFIVVVAVFFALPHRFRWILLLLSSYYFYMSWKAEYALLLFASTFIDYVVALGLQATSRRNFRRFLLFVSLATNLGMLFAFKYWTFFSDSTRVFFDILSIDFSPPTIQLLLPIGISFYVFQTLSYTIDVYRRNIPAERHFGIFALFVSFFPQLVAGPIERASHLLPQFRKVMTFEYQRVVDGLKLIAWGLFKKIVIADRLAEYVNQVFNHPGEYSGFSILIAVYFFAFQIYCDFSGYSDIAIGAANVMGYDLMDNFQRPYFSRSIAEFWRRWHISLSSWLKDYVYISLGGSRKGVKRQYLNIMITFLLSGLWHGAAWTFVFWGALHGLFMLVGRITESWRKRLYSFLRIPERAVIAWNMIITFHLICFGWIFFRANNLSDAITLLRRLFSATSALSWETLALHSVGLGLFWIAILVVAEYIQHAKHLSYRAVLSRQPAFIRWAAYSALVLIILLFGKFGGTDFIYFQF